MESWGGVRVEGYIAGIERSIKSVSKYLPRSCLAVLRPHSYSYRSRQ